MEVIGPSPRIRRQLARWTDLERVTLVRSGDLSCLASLENLTHLESIIIDSTQLVHLRGLTRLRSLELKYTNTQFHGGESLAHLTGMRELARLNLSHTGMTDAGIEHLAALGQLNELSLRGTRVTNHTVRAISTLSNLRSLDLSGTLVNDDACDDLAKLKRLETLFLEDTRVGDAGLVRLAPLRRLTSLHLDLPSFVQDEPTDSLRRFWELLLAKGEREAVADMVLATTEANYDPSRLLAFEFLPRVLPREQGVLFLKQQLASDARIVTMDWFGSCYLPALRAWLEYGFDPKVFPVLRQHLEYGTGHDNSIVPGFWVRLLAVRLCGEYPEYARAMLPELCQRLSDDGGIRIAAHLAMLKTGEAGIESLKHLLNSPDPAVQSGARRALGLLGGAEDGKIAEHR